MAKPTGAAAKAVEKKALAADNKSEGMRMLFEAGYEAAEIKEIMGVAYGYVYGVGVRAGFIVPSPREEAPKTKGVAKGRTKATTAKAATETKAAPRASKGASRSRAAAKRTRAAKA